MIDNPAALLVDMKKRNLFESFDKSYHPTYGLGTMSANIYDTAWVSMVKKPTEGESAWAFPAAFQAILQEQNRDGSWGRTSCKLDCIASTLTALLALQRHAGDCCETELPDLKSRILKAKQFLHTALKGLESLLATSTLSVGLELRIPAVLDLLEAEGHTFDFDRTYLTKLQSKKLSKINLKTIFKGPQSSLLHSLEAVIGKVDFEALRHQKVLGSMLASPSATAAYLMYNPVWDDEAEEYLRHAISNGAGEGSGLVAAGYPTTVFEWAWVTSTLIRHGFETSSSLIQIGNQIEEEIQQQGLVGFVPKACPDADDTAKALVALMLQGTHYSPQALVDRFERENYFATYLYETHTSVSTNANVLTSLVLLSTDGHYQPQIEKCIRYLCGAWFQCNGMVKDKWNISPYYPTMLMCEALTSYLQRWSEGHLDALSDDLMKLQLPITLFQSLIRTLHTQNQDGSWGISNSAEETAYAILILKSVACFSFTELISAHVKTAISRGLEFILTRSQRSATDDQLWLDKTLYAIPTVSDSYIMAAVNAGETIPKLAEIPDKLVKMSTMMVYKMTQYFSQLPSQTQTPRWIIQASVIEAILLSEKLKALDVFSTGKSLGEKYIKFAACFWTLANNSSYEYLLSTRVIYSMVELSIGIFQEDDLMEKSLADLPDSTTSLIAEYLDQKCHATNICKDHSPHPLGNGTNAVDAEEETLNGVKSIQQNIDLWFHFALGENLTGNTSPSDRRDLQEELKMSILAATQQAKAQKSLSNGNGHCNTEHVTLHSGQSFFNWLHTSAVHDVKSAIVSKSLICKIGNGGDVFTTAREKYLAEKLWRQMSIEGRLWNDLGSIERDRLSSNLNSVNFPEFSAPQSLKSDGDVQTQLLQLAEYEYKCTLSYLNDLTQLLEGSGRRTISLYLQMYHRCCVIYNETCIRYAFGSTTAA
ncbi:terpenoid cyclases/protein prenyltransferase alpha-alpha toroid [Aspergillus bertholletiae]|uniref:Terpenoid cyclases/protein prenyltransferase alpha-alpha toroid n=1 Tax=Aspergillus bertholletiae TaxID=1226010 RepID=A0A5N7B634_9EURO|nr:terpenoid cyclases/protein prenyltransferase alpha-alpha toroid [Aspergillus bertholletiae]